MPNILIVDDEQAIGWGLAKLATSMGCGATTAASAEEGLRLAVEQRPDLVMLDVRLPGMDGLTALAHFRKLIGDAPVIVMTAFGALDVAVRAINSGALEYLIKPFDLAEVKAAMERALRSTDAKRAVLPAEPAHSPDAMVGASPEMHTLFKRIALAASSDASVVIYGESGAGKELAARAVHRHSARSDAEFVAVNIAALSPTVAESELFGHAAGAYTGATGARQGLLARADGGTLFLDEVADIPLELQVKLLRAIEQGEVLPVGSDQPVKSRFRVVAATHRDLHAMVRAGGFRHDLFFRLSAFEVRIPALRERRLDIPLLSAHFVSQVSGNGLSLSEELVEELTRRPWHGNVRELRNAIEHASVLARGGLILPEHLPDPQPRFDSPGEALLSASQSLAEAASQRSSELLSDPALAGVVYESLVKEVEGPLLSSAMQQYGNEYAPAARALGLHRTTLKKKLEQQGADGTE